MVTTGLVRVLIDPHPWMSNARLGLVCHAASVTPDLSHAIDAFRAHPGLDLVAVFGPQHGVTGHTQDNMIEWRSTVDPQTGLPFYSLYGEVRKPTPAMLAEVDTVVVDLQDVGTRVYTYAWTMTEVMAACAELGKRVVVLDRPNPIGGLVVDGPMLQPGYESFVGLHAVPLCHGLTIGELALLCNRALGIGCELAVVWASEWRRPMRWSETGLPWVLPSPNMPTPETATVYPGAVLVEGTIWSEGRGTTRPFEILGAPGVDGRELAAVMTAHRLPGLRWRPVWFEPTFQKHSGLGCGGVQIHVTDPDRCQPILAVALLLTEAHRRWPESFGWLPPPYEYVHDRMPIDILAGGPSFREGVEQGRTPGEWLAGWREKRRGFEALRRTVLWPGYE